jgi:hypothetical protein
VLCHIGTWRPEVEIGSRIFFSEILKVNPLLLVGAFMKDSIYTLVKAVNYWLVLATVFSLAYSVPANAKNCTDAPVSGKTDSVINQDVGRISGCHYKCGQHVQTTSGRCRE